MRLIETVLLAALSLGGLGLAQAGESERRFTGYAYALDDGQFRYSEHHLQTLAADGRVLDWQVRFVDANGQQIASKWFKPGNTPAVPEYRIELSNGHVEGLRRVDGQVELFNGQVGGELQSKRLSPSDRACADSGFDAYMRQHWDYALSGKKLKFEFLAAGRLSSYGFRAKRIDDTVFEGRDAVRFTATLDSLLRMFIDPLELTYDAKTKQLLEFRGLGNMHDEQGKPYPVRVSYYAQPPKDLPLSWKAPSL